MVVIGTLLVVASTNTSVFSYLGDISLTPEQLTEVDKDPKPIASGCNQKIELREDAGVLCDAFMKHISEKCAGFDNIFDYCGTSTGVQKYLLGRSAQVACMDIPPAFDDRIRIKACDAFILLNSTYHNLSPLFSIKNINMKFINNNTALVRTEINFQNFGLSPVA